MMLVRDIFQAKYGQAGDLVALFKEARDEWAPYAGRILTDASGRFFTVVVETEVENLAAWEQHIEEIFNLPGFNAWFDRMTPLVESGRREFCNIET